MPLSKRQRIPELMDQPELPPEELAQALTGLQRINQLSRSAERLWNEILPILSRTPRQQVKLLDIACGGGEIAIALKQRAQREGYSLRVSACDINPQTISYAKARAKEAGVEIDFFQHDSLSSPLPKKFDILCCSLFLHHLSDEEVVRLLGSMKKAASQLLVISDLRRSFIGFWLAVVVTRLCTRSTVVHYDGPCSVRSAFSPMELIALAKTAGLSGAKLKTRWPFRMLLTWSRR